jgi:hypothetical protein
MLASLISEKRFSFVSIGAMKSARGKWNYAELPGL